MTRARPLGAGAPTALLIKRAATLRWHDAAGEWAGCHRILRALGDVVHHKSGTGVATTGQLAALASMSPRHAGRCLKRLEKAGLITWTRGGVLAGRPRPSYFTVIKQRIADLIAFLTPHRDAENAEHRAKEAKRLAGRTIHTPKRRFRRSVHVDMVSNLPLTGADTRGAAPHWTAETYCEHGGITGKCPSCRRQLALTA